MLFDAPIIDYIIVPADQVKCRIQQGYHLYGNAICHSNSIGHLSFFQGLVKKAMLTIQISPNNKITINPTEKACLQALMEDLKYEDIGLRIHRSVKTVERIFYDLRNKFHCRTNLGLIVFLQKTGVIKIL